MSLESIPIRSGVLRTALPGIELPTGYPQPNVPDILEGPSGNPTSGLLQIKYDLFFITTAPIEAICLIEGNNFFIFYKNTDLTDVCR